MKQQAFDLMPKKRPRQGRSQLTWDTIVTAGTRILVERGYHGLTTNHVAEVAGVSIGSVYEYFPGKDAIVAAAASRFIDEMMASAMHILMHAHTLSARQGVRYAVEAFYRKLLQEKALLRVLFSQVPFTNELDSFRSLNAVSLQLMTAANRQSSPEYRQLPSAASIYLLNTLIGGTLLQMTLMPLQGMAEDEVLEALAQKIIEWTVAEE